MEFLKRLKNRQFLQLLFMASGIVLLAVGVFRGELETLLTKAIYICLECIGIG